MGLRLVVLLALTLLLVVVALVVVVVLPASLVAGDLTAAERLKAENDLRTTLIQMIGGGALLGGLYFTGRTFQLNREGQVTDRFTKAIDQLGSDKLDVRLGAIYALERIARDSAREHEPIMEILAAFLREHADKTLGSPGDPSRPPSFEKSAADITAALEVLGRRRERRERS